MTAKIADKISKLIAHADSTTNEEEAATFMKKVRDLLEQHGMSLMDVGRLQEDDPLGVDKDSVYYNVPDGCFRDLIFELAEYYGCKATIGKRQVRTTHKNARHSFVTRMAVTLYGRESARVTFQLMWPYVERELRRRARIMHDDEKKELEEAFGSMKNVPKKYRSTFLKQLGFVSNSLMFRVAKHNMENRPPVEDNDNPNALVPVNLIDQLLPENLQEAKARKHAISTRSEAEAKDINLEMQMAKEEGEENLAIGHE